MSNTSSPHVGRAERPRKTPLWAKLLLAFFVILLVAGAGYAGLSVGKWLGATESRDTQVIRSITREEQVILLSAGMADVKEENGNGLSVFGLFNIPGTERHMLVRYEFDAKLGIEGRDVKITSTSDNTYRVTIPEFKFLGYENPDISIAENTNGPLSWTTPEIDREKLVESVLSDEMVSSSIEGFRPVLEEQARAFYSAIITSIDPEITLDFEFGGATSGAKK